MCCSHRRFRVPLLTITGQPNRPVQARRLSWVPLADPGNTKRELRNPRPCCSLNYATRIAKGDGPAMNQNAATRRGRPRDSAVDRRGLSAAWDLLSAGGYEGLNVDEVAERAAVAKTTLYRRWPTKDHLVTAVAAQMLGEVPIPDTGDLRRDLTEFAAALAASPTLATWSAPSTRSGTPWRGPGCSAPATGKGFAATLTMPS